MDTRNAQLQQLRLGDTLQLLALVLGGGGSSAAGMMAPAAPGPPAPGKSPRRWVIDSYGGSAIFTACAHSGLLVLAPLASGPERPPEDVVVEGALLGREAEPHLLLGGRGVAVEGRVCVNW